jgi:peptidoglycan hydrolase-like protein with peptidoglycan-binding domain
MNVRILLALGLCLVFLWGGIGCDAQSSEMRARKAAEKMKESLPDIDGKALAQNLPREDVERIQQQLTTVKEYQGEISGELDTVTVNAVQAFQRAQGVRDDGVLTAETRRLLENRAAQRRETGG